MCARDSSDPSCVNLHDTSTSSHTQVFAYLLGNVLGLRTVGLRLLARHMPEYGVIKDNVKQAMPPELAGRMRRTFGYAHLVLFSLVEGAINLDDPALDVHRALGNARASEGTRQRLRELGELYVSHTSVTI